MDYPGQLSFSTTFTGVGVADAMTGLLNSVTAQNRLIQGGIQHNVFSYFQDDWRFTPKLTLNLGVRYELPFQWFEPHGQSATFVPGHAVDGSSPTLLAGSGFPGDPTACCPRSCRPTTTDLRRAWALPTTRRAMASS